MTRPAIQVVVFSEIQWRYVRTRKQQLLSRFPPDMPILFLQAFVRGKANAWRPVRDGNVTYVTVPVFKHIPNVILRRIQDLPVFRAFWNLVVFLWVKFLFRQLKIDAKHRAFFVSNIYYARVLRWLQRQAMIYDCNDNHLAFPGTPSWARGYLEKTVAQANTVVISSRLLRELVEPLGPRDIVEIGNGVDFELFDRAWRSPQPPAELVNLPVPRLGYAGALAPWIDFELLAEVARTFPSQPLILVGPVVGGADPERHFRGLDNVEILGAKPHEQLPHYVAQMDVTLIPFRRNELTRGVNPNKLHEYMALGKPIVTTDFSPFLRDYADYVKVGTDPASFCEAIRAWLRQPGDIDARRRLARSNSWDERAREWVELLRTKMAQSDSAAGAGSSGSDG